MEDRPIEYVYYAINQRPFLLSIINDNFKYCLEDPEVNMRHLYNRIGDILKRFKQLKFDEKKPDDQGVHPVVIRNYAFGQPSGA